MIIQNYQLLLTKVIEDYFPNTKFNSFGKLEWYPPTEKEIKKTFEKSGIKIFRQRIKCFKTEDFQNQPKTNSSDYRQLLISEIEEDDIFYCIYTIIELWVIWDKKQGISFKLKTFKIR